MKTPIRTLREAIDVCHESGIYAVLTRWEKKEAVLYCGRLIAKLKEGRSQP